MKKIFLIASLCVSIGCVTTPETGRKAFILTSEDQEMALGEQAFREVLHKERISSNRTMNDIVLRVGQAIAAAARKPEYNWEFKVIESKEKNAFCLPGGKVAFYSGIFSVCENEAGLAAVMGHEVAHATARHGGQRITLALGTQVGLAGLNAILGGEQGDGRRNLVLAALGVGTTIGVVLPFSRANESEADEIGLIYMARSGYDPREAPRFWERFAKYSGGVPTFLSTHPSSESRQRAMLEMLARVAPIYDRSPRVGIGERLP